ncbi:MAG: helix-turn-helix domain-containing protein [Alphaproteobacteria bacterium]|nr:helix-turn-helix domain-containing protein [Alphaproteobacteria bacterium]
MATKSDKTGASALTERPFYRRSKAFGRFGMRIFKPQIMADPHWHGHIEANFVRHASLLYNVDGTPVTVQPGQLVIFWANVPHQLLEIPQIGEQDAELCNIYIPLDAFLMMPHLAEFQIALLNGAMIACPPELCSREQIQRWYQDYRSADAARLDLMKMELNALFRRLSLEPPNYLRAPWLANKRKHDLSSSHIRHVVAMVQHILENISGALRNADVTAKTGLHPNYALAIFTKVMNIPLKQFILRMRLLRARGLLLESDLAISKVAEESGFGSTSQFYSHFSSAYGVSPSKLREKYLAS